MARETETGRRMEDVRAIIERAAATLEPLYDLEPSTPLGSDALAPRNDQGEHPITLA